MRTIAKHSIAVETSTLSSLSSEERELVLAAREATAQSYSPYSRFCVGCAIRLSTGEIVTGANHENASYGLAVCAERTTIFMVNNMGRREDIKAIAVTGRRASLVEDDDYVGDAPVTPCGACRQVIYESEQLVGASIEILMDCYDDEEIRIVHSARDLIPFAFGPADLGIEV